LIFIDLVLYFDRIPLWGKFITTLLVGLLVAVSVTFIVKPRLKKSIQGLKKLEYLSGKKDLFLATLKKKQDLDDREEPQLTKTEGRFETYTGKYNFRFQNLI
jgi:hypothetical protein